MPSPAETAPRSRRQAREMQKKRVKLSPRKVSDTTSRSVLLGLLAVVTIGAPLTGLVSPNLSIAAPGGGFTKHETLLLDVVKNASPAEEDPSGLEAVPAAARARVRSAAKLGECSPQIEGANGDLAAIDAKPGIKWPMGRGTYTFTSPYGMRINPVTGERILHEGADMAAPLGTPIMAITDGKVVHSGPRGGGYAIYLEHKDEKGRTYYSGYLHMYSSGLLVKEGQQVKAGQVIALVGSSGRSTGPHLHFEIRDKDMKPVEPMSWMEKHGAVFVDFKCE